jgi:hypothetical protein
MSSSESSSTQPPQIGRSVAVGSFEQPANAQQAAQALGELGISEPAVGLLPPGATSSNDLHDMLVEKGVPEGEARFYTQESDAGRTVLIVEATDNYAAARNVLLHHGARDVQSQGAELVRDHDAEDRATHRTVPRPIDVTDRWEDVISRYEMLWQQHYGTSDASWEQMAPVYQWAWQTANHSPHRGHAWSSEVERDLRQAWEARSSASPWSKVVGPVRDVWEDVAHEAALGAEGGGDRRIPSR